MIAFGGAAPVSYVEVVPERQLTDTDTPFTPDALLSSSDGPRFAQFHVPSCAAVMFAMKSLRIRWTAAWTPASAL
jgi:hypothetical protein